MQCCSSPSGGAANAEISSQHASGTVSNNGDCDASVASPPQTLRFPKEVVSIVAFASSTLRVAGWCFCKEIKQKKCRLESGERRGERRSMMFGVMGKVRATTKTSRYL